MKEENSKNGGFSLVELIVVVLIMAVIATALTLAVTKYVAKAKKSTDANVAGDLFGVAQKATIDYIVKHGVLSPGDNAKVNTKTWTHSTPTASPTFQEFIEYSIWRETGMHDIEAKVYPGKAFEIEVTCLGEDNIVYNVTYEGTNINPVLAASN